MVYSSHFVVCACVDGTPLKELADGSVPIPLNSEYELRFRNKHNRRAVVTFTIDGENVSGDGYIINAHSAIDIKRHWSKDAKFKFVSLESPEAVEFGKNGPNDNKVKGVIEATFRLEKEQQSYFSNYYPITINWGVPPTIGAAVPSSIDCSIPCCSVPTGVPQAINCTLSSLSTAAMSQAYGSYSNQPLKDGCTVESGPSYQNFTSTWIDLATDCTKIKLVLKGYDSAFGDVSPISYCTNCGAKKSRKDDHFCGACGRKFIQP